MYRIIHTSLKYVDLQELCFHFHLAHLHPNTSAASPCREPVRCATLPSMDKSCAPRTVYPSSRRRPCASRRSRSHAPVIRRKTPPRRQRVLSPSSAQWSPGSSLGLWCKSFLFSLQKKPKNNNNKKKTLLGWR